ncbi:unnamed protein product [Caenorhabditis auriculariae]|uniref:RanBD1 domain-containing protein n=1 Tax=Caenorhabditis auriculariae TaxID=2777116 RepID=A0A8S1HJ27_9PELO|nr:unnamed protein product [Caenorhabditis auriculariae]
MSERPLTSEEQLNLSRARDKIALLNSDLLDILKELYEERKSYDLTATLQSYIDHIAKIKKMYGIEKEDGKGLVKPAEKEKTNAIPEKRKFAKAKRRGIKEDGDATLTATPYTSKPSFEPTKSFPPAIPIIDQLSKPISNFAASSPSLTASMAATPRFGDLSKIETSSPAVPIPDKPEESAKSGGRKRAIRGGGVLGGSETVVFRGNDSGAKENKDSTPKFPIPTIVLPKPTPDFWTKKPAAPEGKDAPVMGGGSLFAFMNKDGNAPPAPKFTGFSFGKKPDEEKPDDKKEEEKKNEKTEDKKDDEAAKSSSLFKFGASTNNSNSSPFSFGNGKVGDSATTSTFGSLLPGNSTKTSSAAPVFPSFGAKPSGDGEKSYTLPAPPAFPSLGSSSIFSSINTTGPSPDAPKLTFGSGLGGGGGLFGNLASQAAANAEKGNEEDEEAEEPPKVEAVEVKEDDAILSLKGAVFKYANKTYEKLGVGMVYVKENDGKPSVLIRAATTTGKVWLNTLINAAMKATKAGEKNDKIRLSCPISDSEIATLLIRFASPEEASSFFDKIEEKQKQ